eukprot:m.361002 g.361002  ORF g.361002 m.361002 type:complete len:83 (-) comp19273_c0_seq1:2769-3017(-)
MISLPDTRPLNNKPNIIITTNKRLTSIAFLQASLCACLCSEHLYRPSILAHPIPFQHGALIAVMQQQLRNMKYRTCDGIGTP